MTIGLRLSFHRDISPHFTRKSFDFSIPVGTLDVLGSTDYLSRSTIDDFASIGLIDSSTSKIEANNPGGRSELLLLPNPIRKLELSVESDFKFLESPPKGEHVFIMKMAVSSVTLDRNETFDDVLNSITTLEQEAGSIARKHAPELGDVSSYWTLGGTDLVFICRLRLEHARKAMECIQWLRQLRNVDVWKKSLEQPHHHVFSSVTGILASERNGEVDKTEGIRFLSRNSVAAGHEARAVRKLTASFLSWGERSVICDHPNLRSLTESRQETFFKVSTPAADGATKTSKRTDADSSRTEILFDASEFSELLKDYIDHGDIGLSDAAETELKQIEDCIRKFASNHLGRSQGAEITKVVETLRHSLLRSERLGAIRDLIPFFRQLAKCLRHEDWSEYLSYDAQAIESTSTSLTVLCNHLWRSIRNRIESRVENLDPSFPGTLDNGASKLVNAYSVVAWICWDMFARNPNGEPQDEILSGPPSNECSADSFAACVCSGSAGRVECQEAFPFFREYVEEGNAPITEMSSANWNSRLLLLNISGPILFRPEAAFAHSMHEMAEFSDWIAHHWTARVREPLNNYSFNVVWTLLMKLHSERKSQLKFGSVPTEQLKEYGLQIRRLIQAACVAEYASKKRTTIDSLEGGWQRFIDDTRPADVPAEVVEACQKVAGDEFWTRVTQLAAGNSDNNFAIRSDLSSVLRDGVSVNSRDHQLAGMQTDKHTRPYYDVTQFFELVAELADLLNECSADLAMMLGLRAIKRVPGDKSLEDSRQDANYVFSCMVESLFSWLPEETTAKRAIRKIIGRWAVIHRAFSHALVYEEWIRLFTQEVVYGCNYMVGADQHDATNFPLELANVVKSTLNHFDHLVLTEKSIDGTFSLSTAVLVALENCGDSVLHLPPSGTPQSSLLEQVDDVWKYAMFDFLRDAGADRDELNRLRSRFCFSLWAKSQKLAVRSMFNMNA